MRLCFPGNCKHYIASFLIQIILASFFFHPWDGFVLLTSAQQFLSGITPYEIAALGPSYSYSFGMQAWYAYPPLPLLLFSATYAPYDLLFSGADTVPVLGRIMLKLSFILGNLLCAHLVYKFVAEVSSKERASKAEKLVLYNPFLIFIAAVWGMFDIWMINFILLSLASLRQNRLGKAGIYFGLSLLIKPIPIIFAPIFAAYIWNRARSFSQVVKYTFFGAVTFLGVCLPFFLRSPEGFFNQVVGMHADRPPGGYTPVLILYLGRILEDVRSLQIPYVPVSTISAITMAMLGIAIVMIFLYMLIRRERREQELLAALFVSMLCFTIFSKQVSPQYFVIPIVLAILLLSTYRNYDLVQLPKVKQYYKLLVIPYIVASIVEARHFVTFFAPDVALKLFGKTGAEIDWEMLAGFPFSADALYAITQVTFFVLLIPAFIIVGIIVYQAFKHIIPAISETVSGFLGHINLMRRELVQTPLTITLCILVVGTPLLVGIESYVDYCKADDAPPGSFVSFDKQDNLVGVSYYYWWRNSSRDPGLKCDNWISAGLTPAEGYYNINSDYVLEDIRQMKQAGIDFATLSVYHHQVQIENYILFAKAAESEGFYFAPMIEMCDFAIDADEYPNNPEYLNTDATSAQMIIKKVKAALARKDSPAYLRYEDKPVVFVHYGVPMLDQQSLSTSQLAVTDLDFWEGIQAKVEQKYGDIFWIMDVEAWWQPNESVPMSDEVLSVFDAVFFHSPSVAWSWCEKNAEALVFWKEQMDALSDYSNANGSPSIATVMPCFNNQLPISKGGIAVPEYIGGVSTYDLLWDIAEQTDPSIVLISSWNQYLNSSCIESTVEFGDKFLNITERWASEFRSSQE